MTKELNTENKNATNDDIKTLFTDIKSMFTDVENLSGSIKEDASENAKEIQNKLKDKLSIARKKIEDFESNAKSRTIHTYEQSRDYVKENPATSTGIVAAIGILIGLMAYKGYCKNK